MSNFDNDFINEYDDNIDDRKRKLRRNKYRNLSQYSKMSDAEFDTVMDQLDQGIKLNTSLTKRIEQKLKSFSEDYDIDDLKINDKLTLEALAKAYITLEDYENYSYNLRNSGGINIDRMIEMEKLGNIMSGLRRDISNMQTDLNITRKVRKGDKEQSVISELERLKAKAKEFYEKRMSYIYCEKCSMLLATMWLHYPYDKNKFSFQCKRVLDNGEFCNHVTVVTSKELMEKRGINTPEIVPESMK